MGNRAELTTFLRSRRARLKPEQAGLRQYGERRRVPGLRREELAQLAGVSVDYYVRFEQGRSENVSDAVIDAVAAALRLDHDERAHLYRLARLHTVGGCGPVVPTAQVVRPGLLRLLESMPDVPAYVIGRRTDILAWNDLICALLVDIAELRPEQRNLAWLVFCHPEARDRFVDWQAKARDLVAYLRMDFGRHPCDPAFTALIGQLSESSTDFRRLWEDQEVKDKTHGSYHLRHPAVGEFTLSFETLRLPDDPDQSLLLHTVEPDSPSEAALRIVSRRRHLADLRAE
ncbi:helix-turn-helix transcriptional regulator [Kitasatospora sp. GP82]|uniref:helix-turn-helix transcriptional regulator n=1 Tax=Kitasatospora sp. GP82 TaxID=3035089 RepID=UPI00247588DB|nr:helix-turn-helix transcriptional regulator [Kitasatospora sp. GP82]MDH6125660.1 transcriptional regulator with XRE-family HTH domain [Kitasatospora sp. GP82]